MHSKAGKNRDGFAPPSAKASEDRSARNDTFNDRRISKLMRSKKV